MYCMNTWTLRVRDSKGCGCGDWMNSCPGQPESDAAGGAFIVRGEVLEYVEVPSPSKDSYFEGFWTQRPYYIYIYIYIYIYKAFGLF